MPRTSVPLRRSPLLPALLIALLAGCEGGAPVEPPPPEARLLAADTLYPGEMAFVRGTGLTHLRSLTLDGVPATELVVRSDSVAEFRVPVMRGCETDMRTVRVAADGAAAIGAVVRVPPNVSLRPGESRVLTAGDLRCLRLAAANEDYVLSAANVAIPTTELEIQRLLVAVRLLGTGAAAAAQAPSGAAAPPAPLEPLEPPMTGMPALAGVYSPAPVPFDPRYATAVVGDTLRFVDWFSGAPQICHIPAETVPSFRAEVVAVSGRVAAVVDLRHPAAATYRDPARVGWLRDAVAMTDRLLLPTMRSVFDPDFLPPAGGGGRFYVLLGVMPPALQPFTGFAYDGPLPTITLASQASCPRASEMVVSLVSADRLAMPQLQNASWAAGLFIHEYAHSADALTSRRGRITGIIGEGLATLAEETAARIATGQPVGAVHSRVGGDAPSIAHGAAHGMWGLQPALGPWQFNGRYAANARMLLFLRELAGETSVDHGRRPTLYQRLVAAPLDWNSRAAVIDRITSVLGIEYAELIDRHTLASVTAGLIHGGIAHDLPRYTSWDHSERARLSGPFSGSFLGSVSRSGSGEYSLAAADGGHAALYLIGDPVRGLSLELVSMAPAASIVRLTRLR